MHRSPLDLERPVLLLLLAAVGLIVSPHAFHLPAAVIGAFYLLWVWRFAGIFVPRLLPGRWPLSLLTLGGAALAFASFDGRFNQDSATALFITGLGLKLLELHASRDVYLLLFLAFFVALTQFLYDQGVWMAGYTLLLVALIVVSLAGVTTSGSRLLRSGGRWRLGLRMVVEALPVMLLLFVFFPRIAGPLWKLPEPGPGKGITGIGDELEPGRISELTHSDEIAFRVDFDGPVPPPRERYWRGPVFWWTDGVRWSQAPAQHLDASPAVTTTGIVQTITLEPHRQRWLFALERAGTVPAGAVRDADGLLLAELPVEERLAYRVVSDPVGVDRHMTARERRLGLQVPGAPDPRTAALVAGWRRDGSNDEAVIQAALRHFHEQPFVYTLSPPVYPDSPIERFLFEERRGFCEHYATSFVYLMRVAGIPARVVTGYQGGVYNPVGGFLEVRQADAHAWTEVWLGARGWMRIDPTAAVHPLRIEAGIDALRERNGEAAAGTAQGETRGLRGRWWARALLQGRFLLASVDHAWHRWVLDYDPQRQVALLDFLRRLDGRWWLRVGGAMAATVGLAMLADWVRRRRRAQRRLDAATQAFRRYCTVLAAEGLTIRVGEPASRFAERAAQALPAVEDLLQRITASYHVLRYGRGFDRERLAELHRLIDQLRRALAHRRVARAVAEPAGWSKSVPLDPGRCP